MAKRKSGQNGGGSILLSPKHGLNPFIPKCFYCLKDKNEIILAGKMKPQKDARGNVIDRDPEAPRNVVMDMEPCDECKGFMEQGVILVSVRDEEQSENPYRTGGWVVLKAEAVQKIIQPPELVQHILERRFAFVPDDAWDMIGLPRGGQAVELRKEST